MKVSADHRRGIDQRKEQTANEYLGWNFGDNTGAGTFELKSNNYSKGKFIKRRAKREV